MKKIARPLLWIAFVIYCWVLIDVLFISRPVRPNLSYPEYFRQYTNFIPFKTIGEFVRGFLIDVGYLAEGSTMLSRGWIYYVVNLIGNFVLFLPMGMALPCLFQKLDRFWKVTLTIVGLVVLAELTQGVLRVGSIDVDDVIFNVGGGMLGYGIAVMLARAGLLHRAGIAKHPES